MRIGIDVSAAVNQRAGIGRYARGVLSAMAAMGTRDWVLEVSPRPNASPCARRKAGGGSSAVSRLPSSAFRLCGAGGEGNPVPHFARGRRVQLPVSERSLWIAWQRLRLPLPPDLLAPGLDVFYN